MSEDDNQAMKAAREKAAEVEWEEATKKIAGREEAEWKNETLMKAALESGRAVYHADLHYKLGDDLFRALCYNNLDWKEGDLDGVIAEFREAVRLDSNNALAQHYLKLVLSYRDQPARPEEGKLFAGYLPGTPEFEELSGLVPVDGLPIWPTAEQSIRKVYWEQAGRQPTEQELAEIKQRITGVPCQEVLLSAALEAGEQAYREAKGDIVGGSPIQQGEHVILENKPTTGHAGKVKKTPEEEIHEIYELVRGFKWFCIGMCILYLLGWLIAKL